MEEVRYFERFQRSDSSIRSSQRIGTCLQKGNRNREQYTMEKESDLQLKKRTN
nr:MAG TPA: hypothetical protein [Caudoviricetes sp.]